MSPHPEIPSLARRIGVSSFLGLLIACTGALIDASVSHHPLFRIEFIDNLVIGVMAALVVFAYEQRWHRAMVNKLRVIGAMNHHVRNALQTISYAQYTEQERQIRMIEESVERIEWALREILPTEKPSPDILFRRPAASQPAEPSESESGKKFGR
jgi:hypothetical protein